MKRFWLLIVVAIFCLLVRGSAYSGYYYSHVEESVSCSESPFLSQTSTNSGHKVGETDTRYRSGQRDYQFGSTRDICKATMYCNAITGDISGKTIYIQIWTQTGDDLNVLQGEGSISGASLSASAAFSVTFSPAISVATSTDYGICATMKEFDGSNYFKIGVNTGGVLVGTLNSWDEAKNSEGPWTEDIYLILYELE